MFIIIYQHQHIIYKPTKAWNHLKVKPCSAEKQPNSMSDSTPLSMTPDCVQFSGHNCDKNLQGLITSFKFHTIRNSQVLTVFSRWDCAQSSSTFDHTFIACWATLNRSKHSTKHASKETHVPMRELLRNGSSQTLTCWSGDWTVGSGVMFIGSKLFVVEERESELYSNFKIKSHIVVVNWLQIKLQSEWLKHEGLSNLELKLLFFWSGKYLK